jgi:DNA-binding CsgD family transcriptional regulator
VSAAGRADLIGRFQVLLAGVQSTFESIAGWPGAVPEHNEDLRPLRSRELECLRWSSEGKTAWEISVLLSISERTVKKHIESAVRAMGCSGKTHAVAKAIRQQLI